MATGSGSFCSQGLGSAGVLRGEEKAGWPQTEEATSHPPKGIAVGSCSFSRGPAREEAK